MEGDDPSVLAALPTVLTMVRERAGVDFRDHCRDILVRGMRNRLVATGAGDVAVYQRLLERDPDEIDRLVEALVLRVSSFFREPEVFAAIGAVVLPEQRLLSRGAPLRLWAAGVATGQEAWSLAMLLEHGQSDAPQQAVSLLASDVDEGALAVARAGRYPASAAEAVPADLAQRFLRRQGDEIVVADELRNLVTFARHDLVGPALAPVEAVVASFHVIVVRNVLLYFDARLRVKTIERLSAVIKPGGALVLGGFEAIPEGAGAKFHPYPGVPEALRIFQLSVD
jgi:chemotaxis methyl-accepting protein methylase